jgi:hypothetical protein
MVHHFSILPVTFSRSVPDRSSCSFTRIRLTGRRERGGEEHVKLVVRASLRFKQGTVLVSSNADLHRSASVNPRLGQQVGRVRLSGFLQELHCVGKVHSDLPASAAVGLTSAMRGASTIPR